MSQRIALVEDEPLIRDNYRESLQRQGYCVDAYADRAAALAGCTLKPPQLAIIDIGLGDEPEGGFDLCRELRASDAALPIIFLTARDSELDAISALRLGADDYLVKGISLAHLGARVAALLRRVAALREPPQAPQRLQRGALTLDLDRLDAHRRGRPLGLTLTEFWVVHALARHPGHVKSREQLMQAANAVMDEASVSSLVKRTRRKFVAVDDGFAAIQTAYGMGYRWCADEAAGGDSGGAQR